ncbi:MAG TPA: hypothetical protein PKJ30_14865 [Leptospiraceae bacterium]|nr:hypothetical protein [Leptospiraceae bacterium]
MKSKLILSVLAFALSFPSAILPCGPSSGLADPFLFSEIPSSAYGRVCIDSLLIDKSSMPVACGAITREEENAREWAAYLGITAAEARKGVYENPKLPAFTRALAKKPGASEYLALARSVEKVQLSTVGWDYDFDREKEKSDLSQTKSILKDLQKKAATTNDPFLSPRYNLQKAKLLLRLGNYSEILSIPVPENPGFTRSQILRLRSGASLRMKEKVTAAIQTILAYEASPYSGAADDFRYLLLEEKDYRQIQSSNLSKKQVGIFYFLSGIHMSSGGSFSLAVEDLENLWNAEPGTPYADPLLLKTIALMEEESLPVILYHQEPPKQNSGIDSIRIRLLSWIAGKFPQLYAQTNANGLPDSTTLAATRLRKFLEKNKSNSRNPALWNLAAAYAAYTAGDSDAASEALSAKEKKPAYEVRRQLILLLARIQKERVISEETENAFVNLLPLLSGSSSGMARYSPFDEKGPPAATMMLYELLSDKYKKGGAGHKGIIASYLAGAFEWYDTARLDASSEPDLVRLRDYLAQPPVTSMDRLIKSKFHLSRAVVMDRLAAKYALQGKYKEAEQELRAAGPPKKITLEYTGDLGPFDATFEDASKNAKNWNRLTFFQEMGKLSAAIDAKPADAEAALLHYRRGVGALSASHFGKWWILMKDYRSVGDVYMGHDWELMLRQAKNDFEAAARLTKDPELGAKSTFLSALASQGLNQPREWTEEKQKLSAAEADSYRKLGTIYKDTRFFNTIGSSCSVLNDFLGH